MPGTKGNAGDREWCVSDQNRWEPQLEKRLQRAGIGHYRKEDKHEEGVEDPGSHRSQLIFDLLIKMSNPGVEDSRNHPAMVT
jgi:hypothetical protein